MKRTTIVNGLGTERGQKYMKSGAFKSLLKYKNIITLTSAWQGTLLVRHQGCGFHPCFLPAHRKTLHETLSCPQPKHTVGRERERVCMSMRAKNTSETTT